MTYNNRKENFLDSLQPDDFRNGESFNKTEIIIDKINEAFHQNTINGKAAEELLDKALSNLFREGSQSAKEAKILAQSYLALFVK